MEAYSKNFTAAKKKGPKAKLVEEVLMKIGNRIKDLKSIISKGNWKGSYSIIKKWRPGPQIKNCYFLERWLC